MPSTAAATEGFAECMRAIGELRRAAEEAANARTVQHEHLRERAQSPVSRAEVGVLLDRVRALGKVVKRKAEAVAVAQRRRLRRQGHVAAVRLRVVQEGAEIERASREAIAPMLAVDDGPAGLAALGGPPS